MKRLTGGVLGVAMLAALGAGCCDPDHDALKANEQAANVCKDRGGVPVVAHVNDAGGHSFLVLKQCAFPPTLRLEKGT